MSEQGHANAVWARFLLLRRFSRRARKIWNTECTLRQEKVVFSVMPPFALFVHSNQRLAIGRKSTFAAAGGVQNLMKGLEFAAHLSELISVFYSKRTTCSCQRPILGGREFLAEAQHQKRRGDAFY